MDFKQGLVPELKTLELKTFLDHVPMDITKMLDPAKKNAQIIFILIPKVRFKIIEVTSMLVTDVGNVMCWWQL